MSYFAVHYTYESNPIALDEARPRHRAFLTSLSGGPLAASGPILGSHPPKALLIVRAGSPAAVTEILDRDPFWTEGLIADRRIEQWNPLIGVFAG